MSFPFLRSGSCGALLLTLGACSSETEPAVPAGRITFNNFEAVDGWVPATPSLTKEKAHSGHYSVKVQPGIDYALGYGNQLGAVSPTKFQKITIKGWALRSGPKASAAVVVQILDANNQGAFYQAVSLPEAVQATNRWTAFSKEFTLPTNLTPAHYLKVYLWKASAEQPTFLDDLEIVVTP